MALHKTTVRFTSPVGGLLLALLVVGCEGIDEKQAASQAVVGANRDAHGCIGSAGYAWCERDSECVRPWELAKLRGFSPTSEEFDRFCLKSK